MTEKPKPKKIPPEYFEAGAYRPYSETELSLSTEGKANIERHIDRIKALQGKKPDKIS